MQDTTGEAGTGSKVMYSYGLLHMVEQKQDDQLKHPYSSSVRIRDVALKTCQRRWTIRISDVRESWISVLAAQHDDDEDIYIYIYIYIYMIVVLPKNPWNPGIAVYIPWIEYIYVIYIYLSLLYNSSILDIEHSPYYIALGSTHTHKVI